LGVRLDCGNAGDPRVSAVGHGATEEKDPMPRKTHPPVVQESGNELLVDTALTLDEIVERYYGERILMRITEHDDEGWPYKGDVLAHSSRDQDITLAVEQLAEARRTDPTRAQEQYFSFCAYPFLREGPEYEAAVKEFIDGLFAAKSAERAE
jgi:hypothetical protein